MASGDLVEGIGVAGTPGGGVVTVQGAVGGTGVPISGAVTISGTPTVDVTDRAARLVGVVDTELPAAAALSDTAANPTVPAVGAFAMIWDAVAATWHRVASGLGLNTTAQRVIQSGTIDFRTSLPAVNTIATVTFTGSGGKRWQLHGLVATLRNNGAAAATATLQVWDGATGTTKIFAQTLSIPAVTGSQDRISLTGMNMMGTVGAIMTIDFTVAGGASAFEEISAWAYQSE